MDKTLTMVLPLSCSINTYFVCCIKSESVEYPKGHLFHGALMSLMLFDLNELFRYESEVLEVKVDENERPLSVLRIKNNDKSPFISTTLQTEHHSWMSYPCVCITHKVEYCARRSISWIRISFPQQIMHHSTLTMPRQLFASPTHTYHAGTNHACTNHACSNHGSFHSVVTLPASISTLSTSDTAHIHLLS